MNVGGIKTNRWAKVNAQRGCMWGSIIYCNLIIAKSINELPLKTSAQITFANSPEPLFKHVYLSAPEPEPQ